MAKLNEKYLVRCDRSGVFYGTLVESEGQRAKIINARKIFLLGWCKLFGTIINGGYKGTR